MRAGILSHRIKIQRKNSTRNPDGSEAIEWETFAERWAKISPIGGSEPLSGNRQESIGDCKITIRDFQDVLQLDRIVWKQYIYGIVSIVNVDERRNETVVTAKRSSPPVVETALECVSVNGEAILCGLEV